MQDASILIVEDEAIIAFEIHAELESLGYHVTGTAYRGEDALLLAEQQRPDLVLMDINLRGKLDGIEVALILKERYSIPVVFLTAMVDDATIQRAKICEPNGYIIKPIRQDELRTTIVYALHKHKLESSLRQSEARYRQLFETSQDGILITNASGNFVDCNPSFLKLVGYSIDELTKKNIASLTPQEYHPVESQIIEDQVLVRGFSDEYNKEYFQKDGSRIPVSLRVWARNDNNGQPVGYWAIVRDSTNIITAQRKILRQAEFAQTLIKLTAMLNSQLELPELLKNICFEIAQALVVEAAMVSLANPENDTLTIAHYYGPSSTDEISQLPYPFKMHRQLLTKGESYLVIADVQDILNEQPDYPFLVKHDIRSVIIINLTCEQRLIGTLDLLTIGRIREFYDDELTFLVTFANQAATSIDHARLYQQARSRAYELEILGQLSSALRLSLSPQEMLPTLLKGAMGLTGAETGIIYLLGSAGNPIDKYQVSSSNVQFGEWFLPGGVAWARVLASDLFLYDPMPGTQVEQGTNGDKSVIPFLYKILVPLRSTNILSAIITLGFIHQPRLEMQEQQILNSLAEIGGNALHRSGLMEMLERRVTDRTRELTTLYDLTVFVNSPIDLEEKLDGVLQKLLTSVGADCAAIYHYDIHLSRLNIKAQINMPEYMLTNATELNLIKELKTWLETSSTPWLANKGEGQSSPFDLVGATAFQTIINLPIRFEGRTLGLLCVLWKDEGDLAAESIALLITIAERIGNVIQNDMLRMKAEKAALLEERQRLARELHDSVTQSLYSLTLLAEAGLDLLAQRDFLRLERCLRDQGENSLQALKEMRLLIFELRPPLVGDRDLTKALQDRLEAVERRAGIQAQLNVAGILSLPVQVQEELFNIAREALNNSLKHSGASSVLVTLRSSPSEVQLIIEDNGKGFNLQTNQSAGMGLTTMRDRADRIGGILEIESDSGKGTKVAVKLIIGGDEA